MKILIVEPGRTPYEKEIVHSLAEMQAVVGGAIQACYPFEQPVALICNEEGKLLNLSLNRALYDSDGNIYDVVAGTFFLCGAPANAESFTSLSDDQVRLFMNRFHSPEVFSRIGSKVFVIRVNETKT